MFKFLQKRSLKVGIGRGPFGNTQLCFDERKNWAARIADWWKGWKFEHVERPKERKELSVCPKCGSKNVFALIMEPQSYIGMTGECHDCGVKWTRLQYEDVVDGKIKRVMSDPEIHDDVEDPASDEGTA